MVFFRKWASFSVFFTFHLCLQQAPFVARLHTLSLKKILSFVSQKYAMSRARTRESFLSRPSWLDNKVIMASDQVVELAADELLDVESCRSSLCGGGTSSDVDARE